MRPMSAAVRSECSARSMVMAARFIPLPEGRRRREEEVDRGRCHGGAREQRDATEAWAQIVALGVGALGVGALRHALRAVVHPV